MSHDPHCHTHLHQESLTYRARAEPNQTVLNRTVLNRTVLNRTVLNRTVLNRTVLNQTAPRGPS
jgi:hypothetical protein